MLRVRLVFCPQSFKIYLEMHFQNFQNKFPFIQCVEDRALKKIRSQYSQHQFCDPLVSKYDICLVTQEHRLVDFFPCT